MDSAFVFGVRLITRHLVTTYINYRAPDWKSTLQASHEAGRSRVANPRLAIELWADSSKSLLGLSPYLI